MDDHTQTIASSVGRAHIPAARRAGPMQELPETLPGGYRPVRIVGRGNFATVWEARDLEGAPVAVKVLHSSHVQATKRFQREIKVLRSLPANNHTVGYVDHGQLPDGTPFLVMEYVSGLTLEQILRSGRRFSEQAACALMLQLCRAFFDIHALGVTHGDVKPNNIMLKKPSRSPGLGNPAEPVIALHQVERSALEVKLLDFGLVRDTQGLLRLLEQQEILPGNDFCDELDFGMLTGTAEYIAPEAVADSRRSVEEPAVSDTPGDVFALGVVFHQLLTGRVPWPFEPGPDGITTSDLKAYLDARFAKGRPPPPTGLSSPVWTIVSKALERDPKLRQWDANELALDLERFINFGVGVAPELESHATVVASLGGESDSKQLEPVPMLVPWRPGKSLGAPSGPTRPLRSAKTVVTRKKRITERMTESVMAVPPGRRLLALVVGAAAVVFSVVL